MKSVAKIAIPFTLTLLFGIFVTRLLEPRVPVIVIPYPKANGRLVVLSVPKIGFTEQAKRSPGLQASVKLRVAVDRDGRVTSVKPVPMLPFGVPDSATGSGEFSNVTPFLENGRFVKDLTHQLTESAVSLVGGIQFNPDSGVIDFREAAIVVDFSVTDPLGWPLCNSIVVTVFDKNKQLWTGEASIYEECGRRKGSA